MKWKLLIKSDLEDWDKEWLPSGESRMEIIKI